MGSTCIQMENSFRLDWRQGVPFLDQAPTTRELRVQETSRVPNLFQMVSQDARRGSKIKGSGKDANRVGQDLAQK